VRKRVPMSQCKVFDSLVAVAWAIWVQRNERTFKNSSQSPASLEDSILERLDLWCRASFIEMSQLVTM
jgi:hypothetical protein